MDLQLRPPRHRVDRRSIAWWALQSLLVVLAPVAVLGVLAFLIEPARPWLLLGLVVIAVPGLLYTAVMPIWRYRVHRWETTADAAYTRSGWVRQEWRIAPLSRIQTVDAVRGPLQQLLGLSTVTVTTASAAGALRIAGLDHERARVLVQDLTEATESIPGDAT